MSINRRLGESEGFDKKVRQYLAATRVCGRLVY